MLINSIYPEAFKNEWIPFQARVLKRSKKKTFLVHGNTSQVHVQIWGSEKFERGYKIRISGSGRSDNVFPEFIYIY